jgi:predicted MFS family arabinose efflux permease
VFPALVAGTVPSDLLGKANGLSSVGYSVAGLAGPLIGGALVSAVGAGACFAINALSYAVMAGVVLTLPAVGPKAAQAARRLRPALQLARRATAEFRVLVALVLFALLVGPLQELSPAIARDQGNGAHILGYLLAALAAGGLVGNFLIGRPDLERARRRMFSGIESIVFSATLILLVASGGLGLAMLAIVHDRRRLAGRVRPEADMDPTRLAARAERPGAGPVLRWVLRRAAAGALVVGAGFDALRIEDTLLVCAPGIAGLVCSRSSTPAAPSRNRPRSRPVMGHR